VKTLLEQLAANMWLIPQQVENMTAYLKQEDLDKQMDKIYLNGKWNIFLGYYIVEKSIVYLFFRSE
jgi:hypothetical protein